MRVSKGDVISIKLKSFDCGLLQRSVDEFLRVAVKNGAVVTGPVPLPVKVIKFIVNRSPHKDKKAREQFGLCVHKRLIFLTNFTDRLAAILADVQIPAGVDVEVR